MRSCLLLFFILLSFVYSYKLPNNEVLDESICPSHSAGSERMVFNAVMKGVGNNEEFKKTWIYDNMFNNFDIWNDMSVTMNRIWEERDYFPNNVVINILIIIALSLLFMLYLCFVNPFCWCFSCCCLKDYSNEEESIPQTSSNPPSPSNKSKKADKKPKSKNDCCSCCCCCCGIKCGYCCVTFSFLCCIVAMFFAIFAFANHPLSGYPDRLIGNVNTVEEKGLTRITNSISDLGQSALVLLKSQIVSKLLFNVVGNSTVGEIVDVLNKNFDVRLLANGLNETVTMLNNLPYGSDIQGNISEIQHAIDIFPAADYVDSQISLFNDNVSELTNSMNRAKDTMKLCNDNAEKINTENLNSTKMSILDELVLYSKNVTVDNLKKIESVPYVFDMFIKGGECELPKDDSCKNNMKEIIKYLQQCKNDDIKIINVIYEKREIYINSFNECINKEFKQIQDAVDNVTLSQLTKDLNGIVLSLKTFETDGLNSLKEILNGINNTINALPDFNNLANSIDGILNITVVIPTLEKMLNDMNGLKELVNIETIDSVTGKFDDIKDKFNGLNNTIGGVINDIRGLNDKIKGEINMNKFYNIIDVEVKGAISSVMNEVNFTQIIEQLNNVTQYADKFIFKINDVSINLKDKLDNFTETYERLHDDNLEKFSKRCVEDDILDYFISYSNGSECNETCINAIKDYFANYNNTKDIGYKSLINSVELLNKLTLNFTAVEENKIIPYSFYKEFVPEYASGIKEVTHSNKQKQITKAISSIETNKKKVVSDLPHSFNQIRDQLKSVPLGSVKDNLDMYKKYRDNMNDIKELYKEVSGNDFPSKDYFKGDGLMERVGNMFLNPLIDRANTFDDLITILNELCDLVNGLPKELEKLPNINCDKFDKMINGLEGWIIGITKYIYSNTTSFTTFLKEDADYVEYKNILINFDKNEEPYKGLYYLLYLMTIGGKNEMESADKLMKRTDGFLKEKGSNDITCITNKCIKESITDVWNNGNLEAIGNLDMFDGVNTEKYFKIGTIALGVIQSIVIILPFYLLVLEILYLVFRCKGHNCCCECMFSCTMCCGVVVLLLFSIFGSFAILPMTACDLAPDAVNMMIKDDKVNNKVEEMIKELNLGDDIHIAYNKVNNTIDLNGNMFETNIDVSVSVDDVIKGYLGGCKGDTAKPLEKSKDHIVKFVNDVVDKKFLSNIRDKIKETSLLKDPIKKPINNLLDNEIKGVIDSIGTGIIDEGGPLDCKTINGLFSDVGELACCDIMNDIVAIGSTSVLIGMFMFLSVFCLPFSNICLGKGNLSEYKGKNKKTHVNPSN